MVVERSNDGQGSVTAVLCSGGLDSAVLVAHEARSGAVQPVYVSAGLAWERAEEARVARLLAAPAFAGGVRELARLELPVTDVYPPTHWALRGRPAGLQHPGQRRLSRRAQRAAPGEDRRLLRAARHSAGRGRTARRQPVSGCDPGVLRGDGPCAVARRRPRVRDRGAVRPPRQAGRNQDWRGARRPLGADALLHESGRCGALRAVQQVPRAAAGVRCGRRSRPGAVRLAAGGTWQPAYRPVSRARPTPGASIQRRARRAAPSAPCARGGHAGSRPRTRTAAETRWWRRSRQPRCPRAGLD